MSQTFKNELEKLLIAFMGLITGAAIMLLIAYILNKPAYLSGNEVVHILNTRQAVLQNEVAQTKSITFQNDWVCVFDKEILTATICTRSFMANLADTTVGTGTCRISSYAAPICSLHETQRPKMLASINYLPQGE